MLPIMQRERLIIFLLMVVPGLAGVYFGLFYNGVECLNGPSDCAVRHAGEVSWLPLTIGIVFLLSGLLALWRGRAR